MPIPKPTSGEPQARYISRCMGNAVMVKDFPGQSQRSAVCHSTWRESKKANNMELLTENTCWTVNKADLRHETHQGRPYVVAPCVMLVEGVHAGSQGPLLYLEEDLASLASAWDGRPVTIEHPRDAEGLPISATSPTALDTYGAGFLAATQFEPSNGQPARLKSELWLDVDRLNTIAPTALQAIHQGQAVEISTGLFAAHVGEPGEWNGQPYVARATNFGPDHLAILPSSTGACSWTDGCGIRNQNDDNLTGGTTMPNVLEVLGETTTAQALAVDAPEATRGRFRGLLHTLALALGLPVDNREGFRAVIHALQKAVDVFDTAENSPSGGSMHFVKEVFDDGSFVYEKHSQNAGTKLYKLTYTVDNKGQVTIGDAPEEVLEQTDYVTANEEPDTNLTINEEKKMTICELIAHEATPWSEDDREFLTNLSEEQLTKLAPVEVRVEVPVDNKEPTDNADTTDTTEPTSTLNDSDRAALDYGLRRLKEDTDRLVASILSNEGVPYTAEILGVMDIEALEQIEKTIAAVKPRPKVPDFSGNAPLNSGGGPEIKPLLTPTLNDLFVN